MRLTTLYNKTPKQLLTHLKNYRWTKQMIIDGLVFCEVASEEELKKLSYIQLCDKYHDDICDFIMEEYFNCQ